MVRLREVPRTATFTWSPGTSSPFLATGTRAGAVDADFSNDTQLELWELDLDNVKSGIELQPAAAIATDSRFHDIAWVRPKEGHTRGVIAGALENGSLDLWSADVLLSGEGDSFLSRTSKHSGAIKTLQFNPFRSELLATAGAKGELFISDLNNIGSPFRLGNTTARADDFECLDWNKKVPHILVTGSSGGFVTIWDVKAKKESLTLNNLGRKAVSAVAWDPEKPTRLITAVPLDTDPLILVWDLRNSNSPEKVLRGHEGGVLSLSWCQQDSNLLLSCGKDNRTICWNPQTGEPHGEFPVITNWTFQTRWNPHNPNLLATASFDGRIAVQTIQNTRQDAQAHGSLAQSLDGEDFFDKAQSQHQSASFTLSKAPKWLERPCGVSFGFGGKVVSFSSSKSSDTTLQQSAIRISEFVVDAEIGAMTEVFEKAMADQDLISLCETRISESVLEAEKTDWKIIETLISNNPRKEIISYLGFSKIQDEAADENFKVGVNDSDESVSQVEGPAAAKSNNRLSAFFDSSHDSDTFLSDLAATKGAKTNKPFQIYPDSESDSDKKITLALMLGKFDKAMEICLQENRLSDAFMIAICGGQKSVEQVQKAYFTKQDLGPKYLRLLAAVVGKNLWDVVYNADLENWRDVMAILCTYASTEEFADLCEALGDRLEEHLSHNSTNPSSRIDASLCYIAGSKLEKVIGIWITELESKENSAREHNNRDSSFSIHARSLQGFIEKVTVFREVTHYQDVNRVADSNWKLAPLYEKYAEYADIVAAHGQLQVAQKYLDLLPERYPAAEVARNRVKHAARKMPAQKAANVPTGGSVLNQRSQVSQPRFEDQRAPGVTPSAPSASPYAPQAAPRAQNVFPSEGPYQPGLSAYQPLLQSRQQHGGKPPPTSYGAPPQAQGFGPLPRNINSSSSIPAPSKAQNMANWNDIPDSFVKPVASRRGTPSVQPSAISAPFPNQPTIPTTPFAGQPLGAPQRSNPPAPPPPKASAFPARAMTPQMNGSQSYQQQERSSSSATGAYAPQQPSVQLSSSLQQPQIPRGTSPYNVPPPGPQPSNRYAPAPASQPAATQTQRPPPPPNPYAVRQPQGVPPPQSGPTLSSSMSPGPMQGSRPGTAQSQPGKPSKPTTPKYPSGDRSHIPPSALSIYEILNEEMQRVKGKAPASFKAHVLDSEKRLNILFDHLNNEDLLKSNTVQDMVGLVQALKARDYEQAHAIHVDIMTNRTDECGNWMVGVKRLIGMSRATP